MDWNGGRLDIPDPHFHPRHNIEGENMSDENVDQTEAELERTRKVVASAMAEQIATNDAAASVTPEEAAAEVPAAATEVPKGNASRDEWAAYAAARGYKVDDEMGRDDIREFLAEED